MTHSLTKTRPAADGYTGSLIREALERFDVAHRVAGGAAERGRLAVTGAPSYDGPTVYVTSNHPQHSTNYDVPAVGFHGFYAVITDERSTRHVYASDPADLHPVAALEAQKCAEAVAVHLGLIPFCGSCEDTGRVTIYHHSHDGVIGDRACDWKPCIQRRQEAATRRASKHTAPFTDGMTEFAPQICGECHWGGFTPNGRLTHGRPEYVCTSAECNYTVAHVDLTEGLTEGQTLTAHEGRLYITEPYAGPALPPF